MDAARACWRAARKREQAQTLIERVMRADERPLAIALMGPTASGKSALALEWAEAIGGEIVSVDSALVYRGLEIGSAKPTPAERARVPHHLIDIRDSWQPYSAAEFADDARAAIRDIVARGRMPILAGGTGLYFRALLQGMSPMPGHDPLLRARIVEEAGARGWAALHVELASVDPAAGARIHATDAQRIQRALEVWRSSGRTISDWQREAMQARLPLRVLKLVLSPRDRATLHGRIEQRFDAMIAAGFLDEVRALRALPQLQSHPSPLDLPALRAVGYRQAWEHLDGQTTTEEFRDRAVFATRQLAKRQLTWLRREFDARWFDPATDRPALEDALRLFVT